MQYQELQPYGDLTELNTSRLILDSVGKDDLSAIVRDYLDLPGISFAIYENNGDYAYGIFSSEWCKRLDFASRMLCNTNTNKEALASGKWLCHESCWTNASKVAIGTGEHVDIECYGGLRLYAVPIKANNKIIGSINFGYGDPPKDHTRLREISQKYFVGIEELKQLAQSCETIPPLIKNNAKRILLTTAKLIGTIVERKQAEVSLQKLSHELGERVKELNCQNGITAILENSNISLNVMFQRIAELIACSWQYPEISCARIIIKGREYKTKNFKESLWRQSCKINTNSKQIGTLEVFYLEEKPVIDEGPFLKEERELINTVAERLGRIVENNIIKKKLKVKSIELQETNTALKVLLQKKAEDLLELEEKVSRYIRENIKPFLSRLKDDGLSNKQTACLKSIETNLNEMLLSISNKARHKNHNLTPTEIFITDFIKEGKTTKKMSLLLCVSPRTIDFHRQNIRRKLGFKNKKENLRSYLLTNY